MIEVNIDFNDPSTWIKSAEELNEWAKSLDNLIETAINNALKELSNLAVVELKRQLALYGLGDSSFVSDIYVRPIRNGFEVGVNSDHAIFVEFGTGLVGQNSKFPDMSMVSEVSNVGTWIYNTNGTEGWWYPTDDPNDYSVYDEKKGVYFNFTRGQKSRPFTYNTYKYIMRIAPKVFNKHLSKI